MKFFLISLMATIGIIIAFFAGLLTAQTGIVMASWCGSYFALFALGLSIGKTGKLRSPIVFNDEPASTYSTSSFSPVPRQSLLSKKKEA